MTFAMGELKNKYKNSVLGFFWSILEPLILLTILYLVFSSILKPDIPNFAIYLLLGLIMWNFIRNSTSVSLESLTGKESILSNIYFMRAIPALSSNISASITLGLEFVVFSFFLIVFGIIPSGTILFLPYFVFLIFLINLGLSFALSVLNIFYKDIKFIWNVVITAGFFIHPIIYTREMLSEEIQEIFYLLPTVRLFDMIHQTVLFDKIPDFSDFVYVTLLSFVILGLGYLIYRKFEPRITEEI